MTIIVVLFATLIFAEARNRRLSGRFRLHGLPAVVPAEVQNTVFAALRGRSVVRHEASLSCLAGCFRPTGTGVFHASSVAFEIFRLQCSLFPIRVRPKLALESRANSMRFFLLSEITRTRDGGVGETLKRNAGAARVDMLLRVSQESLRWIDAAILGGLWRSSPPIRLHFRRCCYRFRLRLAVVSPVA